MSTLDAGSVSAGPTGRVLSLGKLGDVVLFLGVVSGCVVMFEPAPYDLILVACGALAFLAGLPIPRAIAPLVILILLFNIGGLLNLTQPMIEAERTRTFVMVSFYLAFTCVFFAATVAHRPNRLDLIAKAMIGAALAAACLGIAGYLLDIPSLTLFDRAKGAFKDPNVFGPFMSLPLLLLARGFLTKPLAVAWPTAPLILLLLTAVLFSFSRAAWFLSLFGLVVLAGVVFLNERSIARRLRLVGLAVAGGMVIAVVLAAIIADPDIREFFLQRAKLVQEYDGARLGRLARHLIGFAWVTELPLGLGPLEFGHYYFEDPHNVYLKAFLGYGWLGGLSYLVLVFWTLGALFPLMFLARPWQGLAQCVWVCLLGHLVIGWIIDSDHWRHFFLLWGLAWGMIALESAEKRHRRRSLDGWPDAAG